MPDEKDLINRPLVYREEKLEEILKTYKVKVCGSIGYSKSKEEDREDFVNSVIALIEKMQIAECTRLLEEVEEAFDDVINDRRMLKINTDVNLLNQVRQRIKEKFGEVRNDV